MPDIIDRLNDPEMYVDAVDDAIEEIINLRDSVAELRSLIPLTNADLRDFYMWKQRLPRHLAPLDVEGEPNTLLALVTKAMDIIRESEWVSVEEKLPPVGDWDEDYSIDVWLFTAGEEIMRGFLHFETDQWFGPGGVSVQGRVTHWRYIKKPGEILGGKK